MKLKFNKSDSSIKITLMNSVQITQKSHPQTNEQVTEENFESVAKACVSNSEWKDYEKLKGVDVSGVMCSATKDDQAGLSAILLIYQLQGAALKQTEFTFSNGNKLSIGPDNIKLILATWVPFRQSFFTS
jgi:hypothetical protein